MTIDASQYETTTFDALNVGDYFYVFTERPTIRRKVAQPVCRGYALDTMTGALFYANEYNGVPVIPAEPGQSYADALEAARREPEVPEPVPGTVFRDELDGEVLRIVDLSGNVAHVARREEAVYALHEDGRVSWYFNRDVFRERIRENSIIILETPDTP